MKICNLRWLPLVALTAVLSTASVSIAQPDGDKKPAKGEGRGMKMYEELGLTDAQKEQLKAVMKDSMEQRKATKNDATLTEDAKKTKMREVMKAQQEKIAAILTPEQQAKWAEMKKERAKEGRGGKRDKDKAEAPKADA